MALIKKINLDKTYVEFYDDYIPKELSKKKENLEKVYDAVNEIAKSFDPKKVKLWFLTDKQVKAMKDSGKYNFI